MYEPDGEWHRHNNKVSPTARDLTAGLCAALVTATMVYSHPGNISSNVIS